MSQFFASGGQNTGASASASVLPVNIQDWFPLGLTGLISLQSKGLSRVFFNTTIQKHQFFDTQPSFCPALTSLWLLTGKTIAWLDGPLSAKWSQLFHTQSRSVTAFPPRSKCPLISQLQSPSAAILEPKKIKSVTTSTFPPLSAMKLQDWMP